MKNGYQKYGGLSLIVASAAIIFGSILHPRDPRESEANSTLTAELMNNQDVIWLIAHTALLLAVPIMFMGFVILYQALLKRGERIMSLTALVLMGVWAVLSLFVFAIDGFLNPIFSEKYLNGASAADNAAAAFDYGYLFSLVLTAISLIPYLVGLALFGFSMLKTNLGPRPFAWIGVGLGVIGIAMYIFGVFGAYWVYSPLFAPYAVAFTLWTLVLGIILLREKSPSKTNN